MDTDKKCVCSPQKIKQYWDRLSGPILDRIDMYVEVPRLKKDELLNKPSGETSQTVRDRVMQARTVQGERFNGTTTRTNAEMTPAQLQAYCQTTPEAKELLVGGIERFNLTGRSYDRVLRISRTIADLAGSEAITSPHIAEALQYRSLVYKP